MIPELLKSVAGSFTRWALTAIAAYLVSKGVIKGEDAQALIAGAGMGVAALIWSLWQKYKQRLNFLVALSLPQHATEEDVKREAERRASTGVSIWSILMLLIFPVALSQSACSEDQLKAIASNIDRVAILIQDGREVRDELFTQGVIDNQDAFKLTLALQKVNTALKVFNSKAKTYKAVGELTPEAKADLKKLAADISSAAVELVSNGTFGVKNPDAQSKINAVIGSIHQVTLALIDSIERLKPKGKSQPTPSVGAESLNAIPVQEMGMGLLGIVPILLLAFRKIVGFVDRERERTGKTAEEIFAEAGAQLDANELALIGDLAKYAPEGEIPADLEARVQGLFDHLESQTQAQAQE